MNLTVSDLFEHFNTVMSYVFQYENLAKKLHDKSISDDIEQLIQSKLEELTINLVSYNAVNGVKVNLNANEIMLLSIPFRGKNINITIIGEKVSEVNLGSFPYTTSYTIISKVDPSYMVYKNKVGNIEYITDYENIPSLKNIELVTVLFPIKLDECGFTGGQRFIKFRQCNYAIIDKLSVMVLQRDLLDTTNRKPLTKDEFKKLSNLDLSLPTNVISFNLWKLK